VIVHKKPSLENQLSGVPAKRHRKVIFMIPGARDIRTEEMGTGRYGKGCFGQDQTNIRYAVTCL
jgi:hypothetical protein